MMLLSHIAFLAAAIFTGALKSWRRYYKSIVFLSFNNLLFLVLCQDHLTWKFHAQLLHTAKIAELMNTFILLPCTAALYLHLMPKRNIRKRIFYFCWVTGFSLLETMWYLTGRITYHHGWNLLWSVAFYFVMFFVLGLHHRNVPRALILSLLSVILLLIIFRIPFWQDI